MDVIAPGRSPDQRMQALIKANQIRYYRAREIKPGLRSGRLTLLDVMGDPQCQSMKVVDALLELPKIGRVKARKAMQQCRISPSKTIGGLTVRQRVELVKALERFPSACRETIGVR